jgi:hypothetical protein
LDFGKLDCALRSLNIANRGPYMFYDGSSSSYCSSL